MPDTALKAIELSSNREELFTFLREYYQNLGFDAICYIVPSASNPGETELVDFGYPAEWIARYGNGLGQHDPVVSFAMESGRIFKWSDIGNLRSLGAENRAFLEELSRSEMTDGLALPTFGRHQRVGYFGIGQVQSPDVLQDADLLKLHAVAQRAHLRLDEFAEAEQPTPILSPREREILHWVARGKTNSDLATILGISAATVATHLQRVFTKLKTNDRVTAVLVAAKRGMIHV